MWLQKELLLSNCQPRDQATTGWNIFFQKSAVLSVSLFCIYVPWCVCVFFFFFVAVCTVNKVPFLTDIAYISGRYDKHYLAEWSENPENAQPIR